MNFTIMMSLGFLCGGCDILYNLIVKQYHWRIWGGVRPACAPPFAWHPSF